LNLNARPRRVVCCLLSTAYCLVLGCSSTPAPVPLDQLNTQQQRGYNVFQTRCAQCHYDRRDEPRNGPALIGIFHKPYLHSGAPATDERVTATILHGRNMMPAQPYLDAQDITDLLAYLHTL
jgi:mono/diheme cytochrome c family protein